MDTDHYTYQELTDEVNLYTGGLRTAVNIYGLQGQNAYKPRFELSGKVLYSKVSKLFELFEEILLHTHFDDEKRLKEILNQLAIQQRSTEPCPILAREAGTKNLLRVSHSINFCVIH